MIASIIRWSIQNRLLVLILSALLTGWGGYSMLTTPWMPYLIFRMSR